MIGEWRRYRRTLGGPRLVVAALFCTHQVERRLRRRWLDAHRGPS